MGGAGEMGGVTLEGLTAEGSRRRCTTTTSTTSKTTATMPPTTPPAMAPALLPLAGALAPSGSNETLLARTG